MAPARISSQAGLATIVAGIGIQRAAERESMLSAAAAFVGRRS